MSWIFLVIAGLFEVGFASSLGRAKETTGNEMYLWYTSFAICIVASMYFLMRSLEHLPIGTAYAVWTGIGAVGTVIIGMIFFKDPVNLWRIFFLTTLIGSIIGLKFMSH